jgi:hypothetical protein
MPENRKHIPHKHHQETNYKKQIVRVTKQRLALIFTILISVLGILIFKVGEVVWPAWMIDYRKPFMALFLFLTLFLACLSPIIIEYTRNPRPFSGPGKDPRQGWDP